jgi:hypothetical protein
MSALKYPWQQTILDALDASAESLPLKIKEAQKVIEARQQDQNQPDLFERMAINGALQSLKPLIEQTRAASARQQVHYHIRWAGGALDWEVFNSPDAAEASAKELARTSETYTIEKYGIDCPRCAAISRYPSGRASA